VKDYHQVVYKSVGELQTTRNPQQTILDTQTQLAAELAKKKR
jgi:hypothetical protein